MLCVGSRLVFESIFFLSVSPPPFFPLFLFISLLCAAHVVCAGFQISGGGVAGCFAWACDSEGGLRIRAATLWLECTDDEAHTVPLYNGEFNCPGEDFAISTCGSMLGGTTFYFFLLSCCLLVVSWVVGDSVFWPSKYFVCSKCLPRDGGIDHRRCHAVADGDLGDSAFRVTNRRRGSDHDRRRFPRGCLRGCGRNSVLQHRGIGVCDRGCSSFEPFFVSGVS